jgi:hypothetical protein
MVDTNFLAARSARLFRSDGTVMNAADVIGRTPVEAARGQVSGTSNVFAFGELTTTGPVTDHLIWPLEDEALMVPASPGIQMQVASTSGSDTSDGTGIQQIEIIYLDGNLAQQTEVVTMAGQTPVQTAATDIRFVQCMHCARFGSGKAAAGDITLTDTGSPAIPYSYIPTGKLRCSSSARRVPAGKRLIISGLTVSAISGAGQARAQVHLACSKIYNTDHAEDSAVFPFVSAGVQDGGFALPGQFFMAPAGSVIAMTVTVDKAATVNGNWHGWFENA